jgi:hypothetical protein
MARRTSRRRTSRNPDPKRPVGRRTEGIRRGTPATRFAIDLKEGVQGRKVIRFEYKTARAADRAFRRFKTALTGTRRRRRIVVHQIEFTGGQWWSVSVRYFKPTKG